MERKRIGVCRISVPLSGRVVPLLLHVICPGHEMEIRAISTFLHCYSPKLLSPLSMLLVLV